MFSKLVKLVTISMIVSLAFAQDGAEKTKKEKIAEIFDNDSDFMRGFETGLFLRTKGGSVEEYGCQMPEDIGKQSMQKAFDVVKSNINMARNNLKLDPVIDKALNTVMNFLDGLYQFFTILSPSGREQLDQYCTGMIFGLQGSKVLVKVANTLINPVGEDGEAASTFGKKKGIDKGQVGDVLKTIGQGILNTAKDTYGMGDEL